MSDENERLSSGLSFQLPFFCPNFRPPWEIFGSNDSHFCFKVRYCIRIRVFPPPSYCDRLFSELRLLSSLFRFA